MKNVNGRKKIIIALIILFLIASFTIASLAIKKSLVDDLEVSANLELVTETKNGIEISKYVNKKGEITFAGDKKYAYVERKRDAENRVLFEQFFDEEDSPVTFLSGYSAVSYKYGENNRITTYLDENLNPINLTSGYGIVVRTYLVEGENDYKDMYFDSDMNPVPNSIDCYGVRYDYDGNLNISYTWLDADGNPSNGTNGYSTTIREYDEKNRVYKAMYLDTLDNPAMSNTGEYGILITYNGNGKRYSVTNIDQDGNPMINKTGYSKVVYTYNKYGNIDTERYYDLYDNPCKIGKGWYGKLHDGDRVYYLNKNGNVMLNVDSILSNFPFMVSVFGSIVCLILILTPRKIKIGVAVLYFLFIMYETILYRISHQPTANLEVFWSYKQFISSEGIRIEILNNIWLFVPYGLGLVSVFKKKKIVVPLLLLPLFIEIAQFVFGIGLTEIDDLISNGSGELIGIGIWYVTKNWKLPKLSRK